MTKHSAPYETSPRREQYAQGEQCDYCKQPATRVYNVKANEDSGVAGVEVFTCARHAPCSSALSGP